MFARGPMAGGTPKADALALLPPGTKCQRAEAMGIRGFVIVLLTGKKIASAGNATKAWEAAHSWALRNQGD